MARMTKAERAAAEAEYARQAAAEAEIKKKAELRRYVFRFIALFVASSLSVITMGALIDVELWKSAVMGGVAGFVQFAERIARGAIKDGDVSKEDIDAALDSLSE
jgi:cytochrome c-type biogenesis protein CcmH/NrfG